MDDDQLEHLLTDLESDRVERKAAAVQRFGLGSPLAREELRKNGDPPPEFSVEQTHVLVTVRTRR